MLIYATLIAFLFLLLIIFAVQIFKNVNKIRQHNFYLRNKYKEMEKEVEAIINNRENQYLELTDVLKNERERIAHELHDDIVQRLVAIRLRLEQLHYYILQPVVEKEISQLNAEIGYAMRDLRYVIRNLVQPHVENSDFNQLLSDMVAKLKLITSLKFELHINEPDLAFHLPTYVKKELYLLVQEAVQNAIKHSAGYKIVISITWNTDLKIEISNDGVGFLKSKGPNVGLASMKERCTKIGATFHNFNKLGKFHATVIITFPRPVS